MNAVITPEESEVVGGRLGRLVIARLKPNEDVIDSAQALCAAHGITLAVVRGGLGSLIDAQLSYLARDGLKHIRVEGPGVEILSLSGEISPAASRLQAVVADCDGNLYAGRLEPGKNLSFITVELTLQEWLPD